MTDSVESGIWAVREPQRVREARKRASNTQQVSFMEDAVLEMKWAFKTGKMEGEGLSRGGIT